MAHMVPEPETAGDDTVGQAAETPDGDQDGSSIGSAEMVNEPEIDDEG